MLNYELPIEGIDYFSTHLRRFADAMILALPVYVLIKKKFLFPYIAIVTIFILSQVWYLRNYGTLMPFSSYLMVNNLDGLGPSIINSMRIKDIIVLLFSCGFCIIYYVTSGNDKRPGWRCNLRDAILAIAVVECIILPSYLAHDESEYAHPLNLFKNDILRAYRQFGFANYIIYQCQYAKGVSDEDVATVKKFMDNNSLNSQNVSPFANVAENRNLIIILVESLQSWPIGMEVNGVEITPCLNELISKDSTVYFSKVVPQVKHGRSSDAQLIINTGLLPIETGAAASLFGTNDYPSLPKSLKQKGYETSLLLCDNSAYWNQHATSLGYGYDHLYDQLADDATRPRQDEHLYAKGFDILKSMKSPYMAMLVTMSGHDMIDSDLPDPFASYEAKSENIKQNIVITHYVDKCIGDFVDKLKRSGMLDGCTLVITGDHDCIGFNRFEGRENVEISDRYIPLIIVNSQLKDKYKNQIIGQYDIYPTLLDEMGVYDYEWRGLGTSAARNSADGAVYQNGTPHGNLSSKEVEKRKNDWKISDLIIRSSFFGRH